MKSLAESGSRDQASLVAAINLLCEMLERHVAGLSCTENQPDQIFHHQTEAGSDASALERLCQIFQLSAFERNILLLCAGSAIDSRFELLCAAAQGAPHKSYPTFSLAYTVFPQVHWSAMTPDAPLRHWRLLTFAEVTAFMHSPLQIDERILHYLAGIETSDPQLLSLSKVPQPLGKLVPSHQTLVQQITALWQGDFSIASPPVIQLCGSEPDDHCAIALTICDKLSLQLRRLAAHRIPVETKELAEFIDRWERESRLTSGALLLTCEAVDRLNATQMSAIVQLIEQTQGRLILTSREPLQGIQRSVVRFDIPKPSPQEQLIIWQTSIANQSPTKSRSKTQQQNDLIKPEQLRELCAQFNLSTSMIHRVRTADQSESAFHSYDRLWETCRVQARPRLDELATRIESGADWQDLVLPEQQAQTLRAIAAQVRQRSTVYETWGFAAKNQRGLGISVLFAGSSGTGKTLAAEVLAQALHLDLYKIDLSSVVSKYIGETEKNLQRIFDAAAHGGVILLFDEADALFGKRSEVKDSRDRYANLEVSYLLQQIETYAGLAILTTNLQSHLDPAFLRRLRFVVQFPFPDAAQRTEIWRRVFPPKTPIEGLDAVKLAQLNVAGGNIRNIALNGAFLAADAKEPVQMKHLLQAAQAEYTKLEKSLTETEIAGW